MGNFGAVTGFYRGQDSSGRQRDGRWEVNKANVEFKMLFYFLFLPIHPYDIYGFVMTINSTTGYFSICSLITSNPKFPFSMTTFKTNVI